MTDNTNSSAGPASQRGLCLLSLDGGGVRGLSSLIILREIMERIKYDKKLEFTPLPCEYFDLIGGTGTGGLVALMLGRLRFSVDDAIIQYIRFADSVFSDKSANFVVNANMFKASIFEKSVKEIIASSDAVGRDPNARMIGEPISCKTFVCAIPRRNMALPSLFRTYQVRQNQSINCYIWEAARATCATPHLFKHITILDGPIEQDFIGGDIQYNNPIAEVAKEAAREYKDIKISCILSLGTGQAKTIGIPRASTSPGNLSQALFSVLEQIAKDCEAASEAFSQKCCNIPDLFFRLNVDQGLQNISLVDLTMYEEVSQHTKQYLQKVAVDQKVNAAVKALLERSGKVSAVAITQL